MDELWTNNKQDGWTWFQGWNSSSIVLAAWTWTLEGQLKKCYKNKPQIHTTQWFSSNYVGLSDCLQHFFHKLSAFSIRHSAVFPQLVPDEKKHFFIASQQDWLHENRDQKSLPIALLKQEKQIKQANLKNILAADKKSKVRKKDKLNAYFDFLFIDWRTCSLLLGNWFCTTAEACKWWHTSWLLRKPWRNAGCGYTTISGCHLILLLPAESNATL